MNSHHNGGVTLLLSPQTTKIHSTRSSHWAAWLPLKVGCHGGRAQNTKCPFPLLGDYLPMSCVTEKEERPLGASPLWHCTESPSQCDKARKRNKRHPMWKGKHKTAFTHRGHSLPWTKSRSPKKKTARTSKWVSKVTRHKINYLKATVFLSTSNN